MSSQYITDAGDYAICSWIRRAIAQMKPIISRAMAVVTMILALPWQPGRDTARRLRQVINPIVQLRRTLACIRQVQAPSISARRA